MFVGTWGANAAAQWDWEHNQALGMGGGGGDGGSGGGGEMGACGNGPVVPTMDGSSIPDRGQTPGPGPLSHWPEAWRFLADWEAERLDRVIAYGPETWQTWEMRRTPGADRMRQEFYAGGMKSGSGDWEWYNAAAATFLDLGNATQAQVGGYQYYYDNNQDGTVTFMIRNDADRQSYFLHLPFVTPVEQGQGQWWGGGTVTQVFYWTENIRQ